VSEGRSQLEQRTRVALFEAAVLPHLSAAYNFARWLLRDDHDAEDVVQESFLRALKFFDGYRGGNSRVWLLTIVRNTSYNWLQQHRSRQLMDPIDEASDVLASDQANPESLLQQKIDLGLLRHALMELPIEFREVVILREMEGLSYREIAALAELPIGTVMSRLARARGRLQRKLVGQLNQEI
jgi:RNA polymerase sigma factor (sigma-70 family)